MLKGETFLATGVLLDMRLTMGANGERFREGVEYKGERLTELSGRASGGVSGIEASGEEENSKGDVLLDELDELSGANSELLLGGVSDELLLWWASWWAKNYLTTSRLLCRR